MRRRAHEATAELNSVGIIHSYPNLMMYLLPMRNWHFANSRGLPACGHADAPASNSVTSRAAAHTSNGVRLQNFTDCVEASNRARREGRHCTFAPGYG